MQAITTEKREALVRKLQALQEKTVENGCTEGEAAAAAALAQSLMDQYGLTLDEIEAEANKEDLIEQDDVQTGSDALYSKPHHVQFCAPSIANYTNVKSWLYGARIVYFGLSADVQTAKYLTQIFQTAMEFEFKRYWKSLDYQRHYYTVSRASAKRQFCLGMAARLRERLSELIDEREKAIAANSDSRALVVVKDALVTQAFAKLGLNLRSRTMSYQGSAHSQAGHAAGNNVSIPAGGLNGGRTQGRLQ